MGIWYTNLVKIKKFKKVWIESTKNKKQEYRKITTIIVLIHIPGDNYLCICLWFFLNFCIPHLYGSNLNTRHEHRTPFVMHLGEKGKIKVASITQFFSYLSPYLLALERRLMSWKSFPIGWMLFIVNTKSLSHSGPWFSCMDLHYPLFFFSVSGWSRRGWIR